MQKYYQWTAARLDVVKPDAVDCRKAMAVDVGHEICLCTIGVVSSDQITTSSVPSEAGG